MQYYTDPNTGQVYQVNETVRPQPTYSPQPNAYPDWWPGQQPKQPTQPQPQKPTMLPGRFVQAENEVFPNSIPNDGSIAVFPLNDFSAVYLKKWEPNGTITTVRYIPDAPPQQQGPDPTQQFQSDVQTRLMQMQNMLDALMDAWQLKTPSEKKEPATETK